MVDIPISWKLNIQGGSNVKNSMAAINAEFRRTGDLKAWKQAAQEANKEIIVQGRTIAYNNRAWAVSHNNLREASRAVNVFGRAMRGAMSIMNTLNLLTVAQSSATTGIKHEIASLEVDLLESANKLKMLKEAGKSDTFEYALELQNYNSIKKKIEDLKKEFDKVAQNETWTKWITLGFGLAEGMQIALQILNNQKIMTFFTNLAAKIGLSGTASGTLWGKAFGLAVPVGIMAGLATASELVQDMLGIKTLTEKTTGKSPTAHLKDTTGIDLPKIPNNPISEMIGPILGGINNIASKIFDIFKPQEAYGETMGPQLQGPIHDTGIRPTLEGLVSQNKPLPVSISKVGFKDLMSESVFSGNMTNISTGPIPNNTKTTVDNTEEIEKSTEELREERRERRDQVREQVLATIADEKAKLALKEATFAQTEAANALKMEMVALNTLMAQGGQKGINYGGGSSGNPFQGGIGFGQGYGSSSSGYLGSNGKFYENESEAAKNGAAAFGFNGIVSSPMNMMVGENGPEHVQVTPMRGGKYGGSGITINNYISGSVIAERDLERITLNSMKNQMKRAGF